MRVGICDDDSKWYQKAKGIIEAYGKKVDIKIDVLYFSQGENLEVYEGAPLEAIFMDVDLGEESGIALAGKINKKWNISELLKACKYYTKLTDKNILFEYIMISKLNDSNEDANRLAELLEGINCRVDLIPANDSGQEQFKPSTQNQINSFVNILREKGIDVSIRGTVGGDIKAACGQLRAEVI